MVSCSLWTRSFIQRRKHQMENQSTCVLTLLCVSFAARKCILWDESTIIETSSATCFRRWGETEACWAVVQQKVDGKSISKGWELAHAECVSVRWVTYSIRQKRILARKSETDALKAYQTSWFLQKTTPKTHLAQDGPRGWQHANDSFNTDSSEFGMRICASLLRWFQNAACLVCAHLSSCCLLCFLN